MSVRRCISVTVGYSVGAILRREFEELATEIQRLTMQPRTGTMHTSPSPASTLLTGLLHHAHMTSMQTKEIFLRSRRRIRLLAPREATGATKGSDARPRPDDSFESGQVLGLTRSDTPMGRRGCGCMHSISRYRSP